jgi:hypothetical protein
MRKSGPCEARPLCSIAMVLVLFQKGAMILLPHEATACAAVATRDRGCVAIRRIFHIVANSVPGRSGFHAGAAG